jgi:hypothetical protein
MTTTPPYDTDAKPSGSLLQSMKDNSLRTAGYAYLVGDAALFASGVFRGNAKEAATGALWAVGGLAAARYGNPNQEKMLEILSGRLSDYLRSQQIEIPDTPTTALLTRPRGIIDQIEAFLYAHPSEMLNAAYAIGGTTLIASGLGSNANANRWNAVSGTLVTAGALAGLLLKEQTPNPDQPPQGIVGKALSWVQEKPLRLTGALYTLNNASLIMGGMKDHNAYPGSPSGMLKFLTAGSYIFANGMLSLSSKGHADNKNEAHQATAQLTEAAAEVIAAQPQHVQNKLIEHVAGFLAGQPEAQMKAEALSHLLHDKLSRVAHKTTASPDTEHSWQTRIQQSPQQAAPSLTV